METPKSPSQLNASQCQESIQIQEHQLYGLKTLRGDSSSLFVDRSTPEGKLQNRNFTPIRRGGRRETVWERENPHYNIQNLRPSLLHLERATSETPPEKRCPRREIASKFEHTVVTKQRATKQLPNTRRPPGVLEAYLGSSAVDRVPVNLDVVATLGGDDACTKQRFAVPKEYHKRVLPVWTATDEGRRRGTWTGVGCGGGG